MDTFKSWLVANLEIVYILALILIILGTAFGGDLSDDDWGVVVCVSVLLLIISFMSIKHGLAGFIVTMLLGGVYIFFFLHEIVAERMPHLLIIGAIALISGIVIALYSYRHFDEVVSRRFLYRNSNVSVFEQAWKYAFNRFFAGFMLVLGLVLELFVIIHVDEIDIEKVFSDFHQTKKESSVIPNTHTKMEAVFSIDLTATGSINEGSKDYPFESFLQMEEAGPDHFKA